MTFNYLTTQNTYYSPKQSTHWFVRRIPTLVFYSKILMIIFKAYLLCNFPLIEILHQRMISTSNLLSLLSVETNDFIDAGYSTQVVITVTK